MRAINAALFAACLGLVAHPISPAAAQGQPAHPVVTVHVPGLGRSVTAPVGVRIEPVAPITPDHTYDIKVNPERPGGWTYGWMWLPAAFPVQEVSFQWSTDRHVFVIPRQTYFRGYEYLARLFGGTKLLYKFDGYGLVTDRAGAQPHDVFAEYLMAREREVRSPYMYVEFYDLGSFDGRSYTFNQVDGRVTRGAMILPLVPPGPEVLALRRRLRDQAWAERESAIRNVLGGLVVTVAAAVALEASRSRETMLERIEREREECRRYNQYTASRGAMC